MKILALNHFFDQDLAALKHQAGTEHTIRWIEYSFFRDRFRRLFPDQVLSTDFAAYWGPEHRHSRMRWRQDCRGALHELYRLFTFDLLILPSDTFPYIRDIISAAHELGIPVVVVQKETTISPYTIEVHARTIGEHYPFIADHMTVCSHRQKQFWLNAGASAAKITITGQPRFDFYHDSRRWHPLAELGVAAMPNRKLILFLSYWLGAYIPIEDYDQGLSWALLRSETEATLMDLVNSGQYQLLVKPHPQQPVDDIADMRARLSELEDVPGSAQILPPSIDVRHLLVNADIIVGFQTTALLEALVLGRDVIYTCWGDAYPVCKEAILPYEQHPQAIHSAVSAAELRDLVLKRSQEKGACEEEARMALFGKYLGPADGRASERTLDILAGIVNDYVPNDLRSARQLRGSLAKRRALLLLSDLAHTGVQLALEFSAILATRATGRGFGKPRVRILARRQLFSHAQELLKALSGAPDEPGEIVGRRLSPWPASARTRVVRYCRPFASPNRS